MYGLNADELRNYLKNYKYISPPQTLTERWGLVEFWRWITFTFIPHWLAPNLVTFLGFLCVVAVETTNCVFSPLHDGQTSEWWGLGTMLLMHVYFTMDGCDGHQARRTKAGSPLGELFDHGCDAMACTVSAFMVAENLAMGLTSPFIIASLLAAQGVFTMSNLTLLHYGWQHFNAIDAAELQLSCQLTCLLTTVFGRAAFLTRYWIPCADVLRSLPFVDPLIDASGRMELRYIIVLSLFPGIPFSILLPFFRIAWLYLGGGVKKLGPRFKGQSFPEFLYQTASLFVYLGLMIVIFVQSVALSDSGIDRYAVLAASLLALFCFGDFQNQMLMIRLGGTPTPPLFVSRNHLMPIASILITAVTNNLGMSSVGEYLRWGLTVVSALNWLGYCFALGQTLSEALDVWVFVIKPKELKKSVPDRDK